MSAANHIIWDRLHAKLVDMSPVKHYDEIDLVVGLIISGGKDKDLAYFGNDDFIYHCHLARLNPSFVCAIIDKAWYYMDNKIPFPQLEEDNDDFIDDDLDY